MSQKKSRAGVIRQYFGDNGKGAAAFMQEYKALTETDKNELAVQSAKALGLFQDQCAFPLT